MIIFVTSVPEELVMTVPNILKLSKETSGLFQFMFPFTKTHYLSQWR